MACLFVVAPVAGQGHDTIAEIRVHGNHTTPDADVLAIAGLAVGEAATEARLAEAADRLRASDRFDAVEVRRRYRSIANASEILVLLLVDERAGVVKDDLVPGPLSRIRGAGMWMPIVSKRDGHALTYGARISFVESLGPRSRVSMPMTWGGERRAAVEVERAFGGRTTDASPLRHALFASAGIHRHVNPHFDVPDTRREIAVRGERGLTRWLRAGAEGRVADVTFAAVREGRHSSLGASLTVDTRIYPSFPRNAVHTTLGWERVGFRDGHAQRLDADLRGYVGIGGSAVLALRAQASRADAPLPPSEQALLGGSDSLRGYRAGRRAGDAMAAISAEARLPLTSPLSVGRFGVTAFVDAGTTWMAGMRLTDQRFDRGIGGGIYFGAAAVSASVDVAWPEAGKPRVHVGLGVTF
jgi:outer membrane protein assembly factor BamA